MTDRTDQSPHNVELQSLRGIAALIVMLHHGMRTLEPDGWAWAASELVLNSHAAVVIFFVLSGYVLSKSLIRRGLNQAGITAYYVRRVFRIYPALWFAILLGTIYFLLIVPLSADHLSNWVKGHYRPVDFSLLRALETVTGLGNFLVPTAWTITVEICASAVLPVIVWAFMRFPRSVLPLLLLLGLVSFLSGTTARLVPFYLFHFALGASLVCVPALRNIRISGPAMAISLFLLLATHPVLDWNRFAWLTSTVEGVTGAIIIAGLIATPRAWLRHRYLVSIGDWSYSIYLLHLPIAFGVARLLDHAELVGDDRNIAALSITILTALITMPLSAAVYRFIEVPGIAAGAALLRKNAPAQDPSGGALGNGS